MSGRTRSRQALITGKCGAKTRDGTPCELPAGWGTDHVGWGRCKLHGGATPRGENSPHFRHGRKCRLGARVGPVEIRMKLLSDYCAKRFRAKLRFTRRWIGARRKYSQSGDGDSYSQEVGLLLATLYCELAQAEIKRLEWERLVEEKNLDIEDVYYRVARSIRRKERRRQDEDGEATVRAGAGRVVLKICRKACRALVPA